MPILIEVVVLGLAGLAVITFWRFFLVIGLIALLALATIGLFAKTIIASEWGYFGLALLVCSVWWCFRGVVIGAIAALIDRTFR